MAERDLTFAFEPDGVYAISDGAVIAKGKDADEVEDKAKNFLKKKDEDKEESEKESRRQNATHIETPNGVRGKILNRTASWDSDEQITVRFDNGRVVTTSTHKLPLDAFVTEQQKTASGSPVSALQQRFASDFEHDRDALVKRAAELEEIIAEVRLLASKGTSYTDELALDELVVHAEAEHNEVRQAIDHLNEADNEIAAPFSPQIVEQAPVNTRPGDGNWLDNTLQEMVTDARGQDFEKLLDDGPTELAAELPDAALAEIGVATSAARDFISARTAGLEGDEVEKFKAVFAERFEEARKTQLASRKATARKQAAAEEPATPEGPDEGLFI